MLPGLIGAVLPKVLDKVLETDEQKAAAKAELIRMEQQGELEREKVQLSAIIAEAKSADPWTSRARPTFLYVFYAIISLCVAGGILGVWWPDHVAQAATNISALLQALPEPLWYAFTAGYLGYTGARSYDKKQVMTNAK